MTASDAKKREKIHAFVASVFVAGDSPGEVRGFWGSQRGDASSSEVMSFAQSEEVFVLTLNYLVQIRSMWLMSNRGIEPVTSRVVLPPLVSTSAASLPAILIQPQSPSEMSNSLPGSETQPSTSSNEVIPPAAAQVAHPIGSAAIDHVAKPGQIPPSRSQPGKPVNGRATFHLPNAKVGQPYIGKLEGKDLTGKAVVIRDAILSATTGLTFDIQSSEFRGMPTTDGDHKVAITWTTDNGTNFSDECILIVNPDPRSLWKVIDPPLGDPYYKPNTDGVLLVTPNYKIAAASRRGRSHEHVGTFRDDDYFVKHDDASGWSILIVADGAGGSKSSRWGAKLAVETAGSHILSQLKGSFGSDMTQALAGWSMDVAVASKSMSAPFYLLFQEASKLAVQSIESEAQSKGVPPKDYSTTLLATVARRDGNDTFLATFWMGDGAIAAYGPRTKVRLMGTPDSGEFAGQTRFLDRAALNDQGFGKRMGLGRYSGLKAVILMTDGISDPRFETDTGLADAANWDALWDEISPHLTSPDPAGNLVEWLNFFTPGHHDDRTIAVLW
jgi:hypothetical protein